MPPADRDAAGPPGWSPSELATLAEIAETFVRGGALRRAELAAAAVSGALDPEQERQLRLVLRLVESRAANLVLDRRPVVFRDLSPRDRERYLLGWARSPIAMRRSAFHGLRKLLTFLAWAEATDGPNPRLAAIGYAPDRVAATSDPSPLLAAELPAADTDGSIALDADVVVVGSGAGGGVIAHDLAQAGRSVIVLEAGPLVPEPEMPVTERDAFDRLYLDHGLSATWDGAVTTLAGGAVGGGTLVNWMTTLDSPAAIRAEWATEHGVAGWDGAEAIADVRALERELGVAEPSLLGPKDALILRGAEALGWAARRLPRNGSGCDACGSCGFGCRAGAKQSGIRSHLAGAAACGARIVPGARVERVRLAGDGVTGVDAALEVDDQPVRLRVSAPQVVVAAGALSTPGILERSGVAHGRIGWHLRLHPVPVIAAVMEEPVEMWRGVMQGAGVSQFVGGGDGHRPYVIESAPGHPGLLALALPWEGTDLHAGVMDRARFVAPLVAVTRDGGEGRVRTTRTGRRRVDYRLDAEGAATLRHALGSMARLARAGGAQEIVAAGMPPRWFGRRGRTSRSDAAFTVFLDALATFDVRPNRATVFSAHQMGSVRMGSNPAEAPCDPWGRVRAGGLGDPVIRGLYVADGSLFPTGLGVNPMLTILALARRVGRTVLAEAPAPR